MLLDNAQKQTANTTKDFNQIMILSDLGKYQTFSQLSILFTFWREGWNPQNRHQLKEAMVQACPPKKKNATVWFWQLNSFQFKPK